MAHLVYKDFGGKWCTRLSNCTEDRVWVFYDRKEAENEAKRLNEKDKEEEAARVLTLDFGPDDADSVLK